MKTSICRHCGIEFTPFRASRSKFCTHECYAKSLDEGIRYTCAYCGIEFKGEKARPRKYCSLKCRDLNPMPLETRFWKKVVKHEGCWGWTGATSRGYGKLGKGRGGEGSVYAHRVSYEIHYGPISDDIDVLHKCDNPPCTNPEHLFSGTAKDNAQDMVRKGRHVSNLPNVIKRRQISV